MLRAAASFILYLVVVLTGLWACAALWFDAPVRAPLAAALALGYAVIVALVLIRFRPVARAVLPCGLLFIFVLVWWFSLAPSNDRDWQPDVARLASVRIEGDLVTIENVRNFDYHSETDFTEHWETRTYDLSQLKGLDFFMSHWGSPYIAHTFVSWVFESGPPLTISIETRKEKGEDYSAMLGFFRQYELYYVVSDERDVARVRTSFRNEDLYLYRLRNRPELDKALLLDYLKTVNTLHDQPIWYNAMVHNCTTSIWNHARHIAPRDWDWRLLVNGYLDQAGYDNGTINNTLPFADIRPQSYISERGKKAPADAFSEQIRAGLPERPGEERLRQGG